MNTFPPLPPTCAGFETGAKPATSDPATQLTDDFSSMLATVWFGPPMIQAPAAPSTETTATSETSEPPLTSVEEPVTDKVLVPLSVIPATEIVPVPLVTEDVGESPAIVQPAANIKHPEPPSIEAEEELDATGAQPAPVVTHDQTSVVASDTKPSVESTVTVTKATPHPDQGYVMPRNTEPAPEGTKVVAPVRRTPTFDLSAPVQQKAVEQPQPEAQVVEIEMPGEEPSKAAPPTENSSAGQATILPQNEITAEAIRREANLVASYLAQSNRDSRENPIESIKAQVAGNGSETNSNESTGDQKAQSSTPTLNISGNSFSVQLANSKANTPAALISSQLSQQMIEIAETTTQHKTKSVRISLRPEELGQVDVQLSRDAAGKVSAQMLVERESTRVALSQSLQQLRETLERAGITVDRLQVSSETSSFAGNTRDAYQRSNDENPRSRFGQSESLTTNETLPKERVRDHKLLSLSA